MMPKSVPKTSIRIGDDGFAMTEITAEYSYRIISLPNKKNKIESERRGLSNTNPMFTFEWMRFQRIIKCILALLPLRIVDTSIRISSPIPLKHLIVCSIYFAIYVLF